MAEHQTRRRWIKLWTQETLHGTTLKELEPPERAVWFELLCLAGDSPIPGRICISEDLCYTDQQLCTLLKVQLDLLTTSISKLQLFGKINRNGTGIIEIVNWDKYQGWDRTEYMTDYMRNYRSKQGGKLTGKTNSIQSNEVFNDVKGESKTNSKSLEQRGGEGSILIVNNKDIYSDIFKIWNSQKIVIHREISAGIKKYIDKALKEYTEGQITSAIVNYGIIVNNQKEYYFKFRWRLIEFLKRENALPNFIDGIIARQNYRRDKGPIREDARKSIKYDAVEPPKDYKTS